LGHGDDPQAQYPQNLEQYGGGADPHSLEVDVESGFGVSQYYRRPSSEPEALDPRREVRRYEPPAAREVVYPAYRDDVMAAYESLLVNPDCGFENFVVGPENRLAHAAALAVSGKPGRAYNPFFIHGGVGMGKSHLLQAICLQLSQTNPALKILYTSCDGFMTKFFECVQSGRMTEFRHRFRDVDILVIDDIHYLTRKEKTQEEFFHTFNSLYQSQRQIILSSDAAPEDIPALEERLVSRFKWGLVCKIEPPLFETRAQIVKSKARLRGMVVSDEVADFIASRIESNIRELEGAVVKIQVMAMTYERPIDLRLAQDALGDIPQPTGREPSINIIITAVCEFFGVRVPDVQGPSRQRSIVVPRQVSMFFARKFTRMSFEEIGGYFGGRDHTTVMHAVVSVENRSKDDTSLRDQLTAIEDKISTSDRH
jgi:chromosomal replication initiator protein